MHPFSHDSTHLRQNLVLGPLQVDAADDAVVSDEDISGWAVGSTATIAQAYISPARNLIVTPTDDNAATITVSVSIVGENQFGESTTEVVSVTGDTAASTSNCFSYVESVTCTAIAGEEGSDLLDVGLGDHVGLPFKCSKVTEVVALNQIPTAATGATVAATGSATYVDTTYDSIKGLTLTAGDIVLVTAQIESTGSDSRFAG